MQKDIFYFAEKNNKEELIKDLETIFKPDFEQMDEISSIDKTLKTKIFFSKELGIAATYIQSLAEGNNIPCMYEEHCSAIIHLFGDSADYISVGKRLLELAKKYSPNKLYTEAVWVGMPAR